MAVILDIADAVVTAINAGSFSQTFTATRKYKPEWTLEELATLRVTVAPGDRQWSTEARSVTRNDYTLAVGVQQKIDTDSAAVMDPLMALVEEIADFMDRKQLSSPAITCVEGAFGPGSEGGYSQEHRDNYRIFTAVLNFTFRR